MIEKYTKIYSFKVMNKSISRSRMVQIEQSVDGSLQESVMAEALQEMREENDEQLRLSRIEMEAYFEKKVNNFLFPHI